VVGLCRDETRTSEHIGISPAEEGWTVANVEVHCRLVQRQDTSHYPGYSPEVNSLAERHQLTMQDVALPSLADSADERHGLKPLSDRFAGYALVYANDLHNTMPASGATVGRTPYEGLLGRQVTLGAF
jgi:hypothetical protein